MAFNLHILPAGSLLYYGSAKFRNLRTYKAGHSETLPQYPSERNFFLSENKVAIRYTSWYNDESHFRKRASAKVPENVFTYETTRDSRFFLLNDRENIKKLLYDIADSPFNYKNRHENHVDVNMISILNKDFEAYIKKTHVADYSSLGNTKSFPKELTHSLYAVLVFATGYYLHDTMKRDSFYDFDFTLAERMREYLSGRGVDGWYQPEDNKFHMEYCFFNPYEVLNLTTIESTTPFRKHVEKLDALLKSPLKTQGDIPSAMEIQTWAYDMRLIANKFVRVSGSLYQREINKLHGCHIPAFCSSPPSLEGKECRDNLEALFSEMRLYENASNMHHVGRTVADHSVWVTRAVYNWLSFSDEPWTANIWPEMRLTALLSAFLHDIGKIGDKDTSTLPKYQEKRDHPWRGYQYLLNKINFRLLNGDLKQIITCSMPQESMVVILTVVALHHYLGEVLMKYDMYKLTPRYIEIEKDIELAHSIKKVNYSTNSIGDTLLGNILGNIVELKYIIFMHHLLKLLLEHDVNRTYLGNKDNLAQLIYILTAISAADVFGAYPVESRIEDSRYSELSAKLLDPAFILGETSSSRTIMEFLRPYYKFSYATLGLVERDKLINYALEIVDYETFVAVWDSFPVYIMAMNNKTTKNIPHTYRSLPRDSPESYITSLLRMLKVGSSTHGAFAQKQWPQQQRQKAQQQQQQQQKMQWGDGDNWIMYLLQKPKTEHRALIDKFQKHRVASLS